VPRQGPFRPFDQVGRQAGIKPRRIGDAHHSEYDDGHFDIVTDVRFGKFADFSGFPIATEVLQYRDGRLVFKEQYVDVRVNEPIPDTTFDATKWLANQPK